MFTERDKKVYQARAAEQVGRYKDVISIMGNVAKSGTTLSLEERNLLSAGYKNVVDALNASRKILLSIELRTNSKSQEEQVEILAEYRNKIENEIRDICKEVLDTLAYLLTVPEIQTDAKVTYITMQGDYHRHIAESSMGDDRKQNIEKALQRYEAATEVAGQSLQRTNPIYLGLALNFSIFLFEIYDDPERARTIARDAYDKAIAGLDNVSEDTYRDSTLIMEKLKDSLDSWDDGVEA